MASSTTVERGRELLETLGQIAPLGPAALLMRHAQREPLVDLLDSARVALTAQGEEDARAFGRGLPPGRLVRLLHSPIRRCRVTAERIAEGFRAAGGEAAVAGVLDVLGGPYVLDALEMARLANDMGLRFARAWFDGHLPPGVMKPRDEAGREILAGVAHALGAADDNVLLVLVTHDWNVLLVRETLLGLRHEDVGWLGYLDGLVVRPAGQGVEIAWREHRAVVALSRKEQSN